MKVYFKIVSFLIIVFLASVSMNCFTHGQSKTMVGVSPSTKTAQPSLIATVDITVDDVENLFASSVTVAFDSTILRYGGIIRGAFLTNNNANPVFLGVVTQPPPPAAPNKITVDQAICSGGTVSGSGVLFTLLFTALRTGSSPLSIVSVDFRNGSNMNIPAIIDSGKIIVNNVPKAVKLLGPPHGATIDTSLCVTLVWSKSIDIDTDDIVRYTVHLTSASSSMCFSNLTDTTCVLTKDVLKENTEFTWYVDATDGIDTTSSTQTFKFKTPMVRYPITISDVIKVEQNYPNPFTRSTFIRFSVPRATHADVIVYDMIGREIIRLMSTHVDAGYSVTTWDGKNNFGIEVGSGIYLYLVKAGLFSDVKRMVYLK